MFTIFGKESRIILPFLSFGALLASLILLLEKIAKLVDPSHTVSCSINPVFSCSGPMSSWQESALGLPNPIVGVIGFSILTAILAVVAFGSSLKQWVWSCLLLGVTFAYGYCMWLVTQTLYDIGALCIYCMIIWSCIIPLFGVMLKSYVHAFHPGKISYWLNRLMTPFIVINFLAIAFMIYFRFDTFFNSLIG